MAVVEGVVLVGAGVDVDVALMEEVGMVVLVGMWMVGGAVTGLVVVVE